MAVLVIAEHDHGTLKGATLNTVAAAQKIGGEIHVLIAGHNADGAATVVLALVATAGSEHDGHGQYGRSPSLFQFIRFHNQSPQIQG